MRRARVRMVFIGSLLLLDSGALVLAFQSAYWTRFQSAFFLSIFPANKGIPPQALYHQTLSALLPVWLCVFAYLGLYRSTLLSAYDEFIQIVKGLILCSLFTTAMTFAYRGAEYSRLVISLWFFFGVLFVYLLRETGKAIFRRLTLVVEGPDHILVVGRGKTVQAIQQMCERQPFIESLFMESAPDHAAFTQQVRQHRISEVLLIQGALSAKSILDIAGWCEATNLECRVVPDLMEMRRGEIIVDGFFGVPTFRIKSLSLHGSNYWLKRGFDVVLSLTV
ncbi:MAG TPA: hypothetical protein VMU17_05300, partial [Elusimicrobiota bacterium]|nr:hypothetical protein [Elusimicrobiota bacterium]